VSNAPSKPVSFSRPKVGYFSNRPCISQIYHRWRFVRPQFMGQVVVTTPHPRAPIWTAISYRLPCDYFLGIYITISVQTMRKSFLCFCCTKLFIMKYRGRLSLSLSLSPPPFPPKNKSRTELAIPTVDRTIALYASYLYSGRRNSEFEDFIFKFTPRKSRSFASSRSLSLHLTSLPNYHSLTINSTICRHEPESLTAPLNKLAHTMTPEVARARN